ncbi:MAG TPA: HAD-IA family hydrolase [Planctomycetota bacterium]|nr:HAD-IA family hydrolase [Planctomycetota bacterium]HRU50982.1 HAD-IA family hydrolase [Planctomycetota bacterium]
MNCKAIFFDLDGTLVDSGTDIANCINFTRTHYGLQELTQEHIISSVGDGMKVLVQRVFPEFQITELHDVGKVFYDFYLTHLLDNTVPYEGVLETLEHFKDKKKAVITNKHYEPSVMILEGLGLAKYFEIVLGGDSTKLIKPDPFPLQKVMEQFQVLPTETVMVGDGPTDILAAKAANVCVCAIGYGQKPVEHLISLEPDHVVHHFSELQQIIF